MKLLAVGAPILVATVQAAWTIKVTLRKERAEARVKELTWKAVTQLPLHLLGLMQVLMVLSKA